MYFFDASDVVAGESGADFVVSGERYIAFSFFVIIRKAVSVKVGMKIFCLARL